MLGVTEPQRKHKDAQKAGHCMATIDHKVRRGWHCSVCGSWLRCPAGSEGRVHTRRLLLKWQIFSSLYHVLSPR